ncbi:MAG: hypothetical protein IJM54_04580 [Thermoguttaceae bacterium]|nr:hypothetical protein [Thermoguttaceae bacterium]
MKDASFVSRLSIVATLSFVTLCYVGCNRSDSPAQHGAGQHATAQDKERQNRNLLDQVVEITENQEKYPDPTYLRGAIGRLNSWLAEKPKSPDFEPDEEFAALADSFKSLATDLRRVGELIRLFADEAKKPEEKDGVELQSLVESVQKQTEELGVKTSSNALVAYSRYFDDLKNQLASAKEFQFADATETFQTKIRDFVKRPASQFYNCEGLLAGIEDFQRLLLVDGNVFLPQDADFLRESVWFRDVFSWAKGEKQDDLTIVKNLFDWSVQNVVVTPLMPGPAGPMSQTAWQTLLLSQGTAMDRAIVFMELLRQHRLDAFVLRPAENANENFPLVVGVRLNGETYLFLPEYSLPIPGEGDDSIVLDKGLQFNSIATLTQVARNDSLLRRFDLTGKPFPATSKDFEKVVAFAPSTPFTVSSRMIAMEQEFSGKVNTVLSTPFESQKARIAELDGIVDVQRLYEATAPVLEQAIFPFESEDLTQIYMIASSGQGANLDVSDSEASTNESIDDYTNSDSQTPTGNMTSTKKTQNASLWIGKNLYLRGRFVDDNGASLHFLQGRVSERLLKQEEASVPQRVREYVTEYQNWRASQNESATKEELEAVSQEALMSFQIDVTTKRYVKILTSFYLALLSEAMGNDDAALERLNDDSLRIRAQANPNSRSYGEEWRYAANYLRARILEKQGKIETAIIRFQIDPNKTGDLVRAQWLAQLAGIAIDTNPQTEQTPQEQTEVDGQTDAAEATEQTEAQVEPTQGMSSESSEPAQEQPEVPAEQTEQPQETPSESIEPAQEQPDVPAEQAEQPQETPSESIEPAQEQPDVPAEQAEQPQETPSESIEPAQGQPEVSAEQTEQPQETPLESAETDAIGA